MMMARMVMMMNDHHDDDDEACCERNDAIKCKLSDKRAALLLSQPSSRPSTEHLVSKYKYNQKCVFTNKSIFEFSLSRLYDDLSL